LKLAGGVRQEGIMFNIGDFVVCPGHGVGQICDIEDKELGCERRSFYIIKVLASDMKVMVPVSNSDGVRVLSDRGDIDKVYQLLQDHNVKVDNSTWNRRYREYMLKIKTGSILEVADVLRSLFLLKQSKNLSFGEKKMLDQCKELLAEEISLSAGVIPSDVKGKIDSIFDRLA